MEKLIAITWAPITYYLENKLVPKFFLLRFNIKSECFLISSKIVGKLVCGLELSVKLLTLFCSVKQVGVLSAHAVLCGGLAWWCGRASGVAPERRLPRACWLALAGGGAALATTLPAWSPGAAAEGAVHVVWAVFAAYALLPVGAPVAAAFGILLPTVHTIAAALVAHRFPYHVWQQVSYLFCWHRFVVYCCHIKLISGK